MDFQTPQKQMSFSRELRMVLQERNLLSAKSREKVCSMLNGSHVSTSCTPIQFPKSSSSSKMTSDRRRLKDFRYQAVQEIIDTEKAYLSQLELLMKYFVLPLKEQRLIEIASHTLLFGQIEMIHSLNGEFLRTLEADMSNVAQAFLKMAPFFKLYSVYAFDYRNALLVLQDLTSNNPAFRKFLEQSENHPEVQRKLISLMIVPIQRVPRYKLLLQQVLYYTSPADPDFKVLRESIKQIESTVSHINNCIEDQETTQMLINLQNSLLHRQPNIVKPSRKVIKEGVLMKVTRNGTEIKRYCVLMSDIFMYCKVLKERSANTHVDNSLECCCIFPLNKCKVYEHLPGNFKLTCQSDGIIFSTKDLQLQRNWMSSIRDAIEMHLQGRKTLRKESSKRTPLRKKDIKNFGTDYILSPNKIRKGEYETIFRNENRNSDSEDSDDDKRSKSCFKLSMLTGQHGGSKKLNNRKRKASSLSLQAAPQRLSVFNKYISTETDKEEEEEEASCKQIRKPIGNSQAKRKDKITPQHGESVGILKQNPGHPGNQSIKANMKKINECNPPSYGIACHQYSGTKTPLSTDDVYRNMTTAHRPRLEDARFQTADLYHSKKPATIELQHTDSVAIQSPPPPLRKRVKFDDDAYTTIDSTNSRIVSAENHQIYYKPYFETLSSIAEEEAAAAAAPLYQKIWNFVSKLF